MRPRWPGQRNRVTRWLVLLLGLLVAAGVLYLLASGGGGGRAPDEIDDASRARLERVLREADREADER